MWHFVKNRTYWIQMKTECIFSSSSPYPFHSRMAPPIPRCCWCYLRCNKLALKWSGIGFQLLLSLSRTIFYRTRMSESKGGKLFPYYWQGSTKMSSWLLLEIWYVLQCGQKKFQKEQFFHTSTYFYGQNVILSLSQSHITFYNWHPDSLCWYEHAYLNMS